jgi:flagellar hook-basal body complex protein FliE
MDPINSINSITGGPAKLGSAIARPDFATRAGESAATPPGGQSTALDNFGQMLADAIGGLGQTEARANQAMASLAAGEDVELHQVMLAVQEADIALQLGMQVRNKIVEAYQEVMRMQV